MVEDIIQLNITGQLEILYPTTCLRWKKNKSQRYKLQQKFINKDTQEEIWKYIPKIEFTEKD